MKLPKKIKINGTTYSVIKKPNVVSSDNSMKLLGQNRAAKAEIEIDSEHSDQGNTFFHEVLHGIFYEYGIREPEKEELYVTVLTNGILSFLRNNKEVARELIKDNK